MSIFDYKGTIIDYEYTKANQKTTAVVLLHGWGGSKDSLRCFGDRIKDNVLNIDLPPFAKSMEPSWVWDLQDYTDMCLALINHLGISRVNIIAHSFGGRIAIRLASTTALVDKMVLIDIAGFERKTFRTRLKIHLHKLKKKLVRIGIINQLKIHTLGSSDYSVLSDNMKKVFNKIVNEVQFKELSNIKCKALIVWGKTDKDTKYKTAKYLSKRLNAQLLTLKGGHFAYLEQPNFVYENINNFFK